MTYCRTEVDNWMIACDADGCTVIVPAEEAENSDDWTAVVTGISIVNDHFCPDHEAEAHEFASAD